jgi:hypothetical protein
MYIRVLAKQFQKSEGIVLKEYARRLTSGRAGADA